VSKLLIIASMLFAHAAHATPVDISQVDLVCKDPGVFSDGNGPERGRTGYLYIRPAEGVVYWTYLPYGKDRPGKTHPIQSYIAAPDGPGKARLVIATFGKDGQYLIAITGDDIILRGRKQDDTLTWMYMCAAYDH
jgi:hypothetical protein